MGVLAVITVALLAPAAALSAPVNDDFAARLQLQLDTTDTRSNSASSIETEEHLTANDPNGFGCEKGGSESTDGVPMTNTMWWKFTGTGDWLTVSTRGSTVDTVVALYESGSSILIGCNDDLQPIDHTRPNLHFNVDSEVAFESVSDREYAIQVGACTPVPPETCGASEGNVALRVSQPPLNDGRSNPRELLSGIPILTRNTGATTEPGETALCGLSPFAKTVWFRYVAPAIGSLVVASSGIDTVLSIYREGATPIDCNDDSVKGESGGSRLPPIAPAGTPLLVTPGAYLIQVGGYHDPGFSTVAAADGPLQVEALFSEDTDVDNDGIARGPDCDDSDAGIHPGAAELPNNSKDEDCDGVLAVDRDGDGSLAPPAGGDCGEQNARVHPGAKEVRGNKVDENCDGVVSPSPRLKPTIALFGFRYDGADAHTSIRTVTVGSVPVGSRIELRCSGGCPFRTKGPIRVRQPRGKLVAAHGFRVDAGASMEVRVTKAEWIGRAKIFHFPRDRTRRESERCIDRGGALVPCARG